MAPVYPEYAVSSFLHFFSLYHLWPHIHVLVPPALTEVMEDFHQPKCCHQLSDLLDVWVLEFYGVGADLLYHHGILVPEACQRLIQVRKVLHGGWQELCADNWVCDDLVAHHIHPMEACCLYDPYLGSVPDNHLHSPLCTVRRRRSNRRAYHIVSQPNASIILVDVLGLFKYHQVEAANMCRPDGLHKPGSLYVSDVEVLKG